MQLKSDNRVQAASKTSNLLCNKLHQALTLIYSSQCRGLISVFTLFNVHYTSILF